MLNKEERLPKMRIRKKEYLDPASVSYVQPRGKPSINSKIETFLELLPASPNRLLRVYVYNIACG
jgi:hypothetical protein